MVIRHFKQAIKKYPLVYSALRRFIDYITLYRYKIIRRNDCFIFEGRKLKYFYHIYNTTYRNERCIEIPIILNILKNEKNGEGGKEILEVGNVLSHYIQVDHDIVDKYEKGLNVKNIDIVNYSGRQYDLIISISTFEHIGFDEEEREPEKIIKAIENMKNLLKKSGKIIFTVPLGYNRFLDELIFSDHLKIDKKVIFIRLKKDEWVETRQESFDYKEIMYNYPYPCANAILIGWINK